MKVEISQQPKLKKLDHLFVLAAEGADLDGVAADVAARAATKLGGSSPTPPIHDHLLAILTVAVAICLAAFMA